jgi:TetR/AcrR family transcriptional regulator
VTPRPRRTGATKEKLFAATLNLVATKGMAALTVDDVAAEAGVAKGTVYYNFGSKDGLIEALLRHGLDLLATRLRAAEQATAAGDTLALLIDGALAFFADFPAFGQLLVSELWRTPGQWHQTLTLIRDEVTSIIRARLQWLADKGELPAGVDVHTASAALFGTILVIAQDWLVFQPSRTRAEVRDSVLMLVRGLRGT